MTSERARQVESWKFAWQYYSPRHVKQSWAWQNVCVTVQPHWMTTTYNHGKSLDRWEQVCSWLGLIIWYTTFMRAVFFWVILSSTWTMNLVITAQLEVLTKRIPSIVSHMRWLMLAVVRFRGVCSRLVQLSWAVGLRILDSLLGRRIVVMISGEGMKSSTRRRIKTSLFAVSRKDIYPGMSDGRSVWTIDNDRSWRKYIGWNPKIMKSILESKNCCALHSRLYDGMHRLFSNKNIVFMICRSGRHRSVASAELWSNTMTRKSQRQHSVSFLHLSELDFGRDTYAGNC